MGNRIGIDISGTLVRVSCICFPCDSDGNVLLDSSLWNSLKREPSGNNSNAQDEATTRATESDAQEQQQHCSSYHRGEGCCGVARMTPTSSEVPPTTCCNHQSPITHPNHSESHCPYRRPLHSHDTSYEIAIKNYLDCAPLWGPPRTFCFNLCGPQPGKAFCFVIDLKNAEDAVREVHLHYVAIQENVQ